MYIPKHLTDFQRTERVRICKENLEKFEKKMWRLCDVVTSDASSNSDLIISKNVPRSKSTGRIRQEGTGNQRKIDAGFPWTDPVTGFLRFRLETTGICQNRYPDTVTGFLGSNSWHFPAGFGQKRSVS